MSTLQSEVVLQPQFTTNTEVIFVFSSQEGNFTVCTQCIRNGDAKANFTRELSVSLFAVNSNDSRASLNVVGSSTDFAFVANVDIGGGSGVVIASPTCVGFDVDLRPCKGSACGHRQSSSSREYRFDHLFLPLSLLAEWLPADERGIDNSPLYPFVTEITV